MTVEVVGDTIRLTGRCGVEDAERLLELLGQGARRVDLSGCEHLHTALVQILLAARAGLAAGGAPMLPEWLRRILDTAERPPSAS